MDKEKLIKEFLNSPVQVGEYVSFESNKDYENGKEKNEEILSIDNKNKTFNTGKNSYSGYRNVPISNITFRNNQRNIGADPFIEDDVRIKQTNFPLGNIVSYLDLTGDRGKNIDIEGTLITNCNWNPYVYTTIGKKYYQRNFVWSREENQNLIHSIYENIECGKILVCSKEFDEIEEMYEKGERELSFFDIVDGKQRLNAILKFLTNEYPDKNGNYWKDFSRRAQRKFEDSQSFTFCELIKATDKQVLTQFLKLNFTGIPQSKEHLEFIKGLRKEVNHG